MGWSTISSDCAVKKPLGYLKYILIYNGSYKCSLTGTVWDKKGTDNLIMNLCGIATEVICCDAVWEKPMSSSGW